MNRRAILKLLAAATALGQVVPVVATASPVAAMPKVINMGGALSLNTLDEAIGAVDAPGYIVMSKRMRNLLNAGNREDCLHGFITWDKNKRGDRVAHYKNIPIIATDYDGNGGQLIDFDEGDDNTTSIYVVSNSEEAEAAVYTLDNLADILSDRFAAGGPLTKDEMSEAVKAWRTDRMKGEADIQRLLIATADVRVAGIRKAHVRA